MKSKLLGLTAVAALAIGFAASGAQAQSSKFTAAYETDTVGLAFAYTGTANDPDFDFGFEKTVAYIKSPQGKELLIGVSGVANLITFTQAKGSNKGGKSTAEALAGIGMAVRYAPADQPGPVCLNGMTAAPGIVPLSVRYQKLSVDVDLDVIGSSEELDIEGYVEVGLLLATSAAHHFNFLAADLPQSTTYKVAACFVGFAYADVNNDDNKALSAVLIGKRMVTVQGVRAVKDTEFDVTN